MVKFLLFVCISLQAYCLSTKDRKELNRLFVRNGLPCAIETLDLTENDFSLLKVKVYDWQDDALFKATNTFSFEDNTLIVSMNISVTSENKPLVKNPNVYISNSPVRMTSDGAFCKFRVHYEYFDNGGVEDCVRMQVVRSGSFHLDLAQDVLSASLHKLNPYPLTVDTHQVINDRSIAFFQSIEYKRTYTGDKIFEDHLEAVIDCPEMINQINQCLVKNFEKMLKPFDRSVEPLGWMFPTNPKHHNDTYLYDLLGTQTYKFLMRTAHGILKQLAKPEGEDLPIMTPWKETVYAD